ncbi:hypothetical protein JCM14076_26620 [Methylosoma difficile]
MTYIATSHCPHCFKPSRQALCQACGFDRDRYVEEAQHLALFTEIGGQYTLGRMLGSGGFAIVYIAKKAGEDTLFAVKEYFPEQLASRSRSGSQVIQKSGESKAQWFATCYKRFIDEARLLETCQKHPSIAGIVRYADLVEQNGSAYLVMEYLDGCSLFDAWLPQQKLSPAQIKPWLKPLLDTLEKLHQRQIYHRDISLKNIFLRGGPQKLDDPVLMDFGLAREGVRESHIKSSVIGVGTPDYLAPEQAANNPETRIDARTDLYSLGAVLFHCLNGTPPPTVETRRLGAPLVFALKDLDPNLKATIESCLSLAKEGRPQDAAALKKRLAAFLHTGETIIPDHEDAQLRATDLALWQQARRLDTLAGYQSYLQNCQLCQQQEAAEEAVKRLGLEAELKKHRPQKPDNPSKLWLWLVLVSFFIAAAVFVKTHTDAGDLSTDGSEVIVWPTPAKPDPYKMDMVAITGGCFQMGSPASEKDRENDEKQHQACVADFYLGKHEVSKGQFAAFVSATGYRTEAEAGDGCHFWTGTEWKKDKQRHWRNLGFAQNDDHPVACVSWNDAQAYIAWLNQQTHKNYRLPTEAEWEYAARAGTATPFYTGACISTQQANYHGHYDYNSCGAKTGLYLGGTSAVGGYPANPWGLYDMAGNVWEWTCSAYVADYDGSESKCISNNDAKTLRVLRGGSWSSHPWRLRSAVRDRSTPGTRGIDVGFRLSRM